MINVRTIKKMLDGDTLNLKNGKIKKYKGGFQVDILPIELSTPERALEYIKMHADYMHLSFSIKFKNGKYYVSRTDHAYTRRQARELAEKYKNATIYEWQNLIHQAV